MKAAATNSSWIAQWVPPALRRIANRLAGSAIRYSGPFASLEQARRQTSGYDDDAILAKVQKATGDVLSGKARYEQDGCTFQAEPPPDQALAGLLLAASVCSGRISVLDFGGSLGSHYLRWSPLLSRIPELNWCVVEQDHFVRAGRRLHGHDPRIRFESDIEAAKTYRPNVVLASGVLQYLDAPHATLARLCALNTEVIILDRTAFSDDGEDRIYAQHVPRQLQRSSYPLTALAASRVEGALSATHVLVQEFPTRDEPIRTAGGTARYGGAIWQRRG
jgi:putative methyltransferase (TIGR04325 family)